MRTRSYTTPHPDQLALELVHQVPTSAAECRNKKKPKKPPKRLPEPTRRERRRREVVPYWPNPQRRPARPNRYRPIRCHG